MDMLMLSNDLVFPSRVVAAAEGHTVQTVATMAALLSRGEQGDKLDLVILDLATSGCDVVQIVQSLNRRDPPPRMIAFAPHVKTSLLDAARQAGCDQVLTQGQFDRRLNELLSE